VSWYGITLVSEGPTDVGDLADPMADWEATQVGFLQNVLRGSVPQHDLQFFDGRAVAFDLDEVTNVSSALEAKAKRAGALAAYRDRSHAVVYVVDADNDLNPTLHRLNPIERGLRSGIETVPDVHPIPIGAIAHKTIEAWVLADEVAVIEVAGDRLTGPIPPAPESLWGTPHDPNSNHPKQVLRRLFGGQLSRSDYAFVGAAATPVAIAGKCPTGFGPLHTQIVAACP